MFISHAIFFLKSGQSSSADQNNLRIINLSIEIKLLVFKFLDLLRCQQEIILRLLLSVYNDRKFVPSRVKLPRGNNAE